MKISTIISIKRINPTTFLKAGKLYQFWMILVFLLGGSAGLAVVVSFADAMCFQMLGDDSHLYGNQRLWGAVGWGTFSFLAGYLVDVYSDDEYEKDYTIPFFMVLGFLLIDVLVCTKLKVHYLPIFSLGKIFKNNFFHLVQTS